MLYEEDRYSFLPGVIQTVSISCPGAIPRAPPPLSGLDRMCPGSQQLPQMTTQSIKYSFRLISYLVALAMALCCPACTDSRRQEGGRKSPEWKVGYWYWQAWGKDCDPVEEGEAKIDLLYVKACDYRGGTLDAKPADVEMDWPERLPKAQAYVAVFRCEGAIWTDGKLIAGLAGAYESVKGRAARRGQSLKGLQIDYDCPTKELNRYGRFLADLRKVLPREDMLSITALLDWFKPGTKVEEVIGPVDEFVPQFYDVDPRKLDAPDGGIAEPIDPTRWAPVFNAYRKPYRVGIASFGRIMVKRTKKEGVLFSDQTGGWAAMGSSPLDLVTCCKGTFVAQGTSTAGEIIARLRSDRIETVKMIVPTAKSVASAYHASEAMAGYCSGALFFRYPTRAESLALSPGEIGRAIAGRETMQEATTVEVDDGFCAVVSCSDLFVRLKERFPAKNLVLTIQSSHDLDYFVPDRLVHATLRGQRLIEVRIPAFAGVPRIPVGRVVSRDPVRFTVEEKP
jgi:hypothetical protein